MKYKITPKMLAVQETESMQKSVIQFELFKQKYNRAPELLEFFSLEKEIVDLSEKIFEEEFVKKYNLRGGS